MRAFSLDLVRQAFEKTATDSVPRKLLLEADAWKRTPLRHCVIETSELTRNISS